MDRIKKFNVGLFGKIFLYTLLFLGFVVAAFTVFYADQLRAAFAIYNRRQHMRNFSPLLRQLELSPDADIEELAWTFRERNESLEFYIQADDGTVLFQTPLTPPGVRINYGTHETRRFIAMSRGDANYGRFAITISPNMNLYVVNRTGDWIEDGVDGFAPIVPFVLTLLTAGAMCAFLLAKLIARPIKQLAASTESMVKLEDVPPPTIRRDEIGKLSRDVHNMYEQLKNTIGELEREIEYKKEIEENQRAFFSAASHELKTPIAGTTAIIEAMMEDLIEREEFPAYLNQCMDMMNAQSNLISEILEIVRFNDGRITPTPEEFNLAEFIDGILPTYNMLASRKRQTLTSEIPTDVLICADRTMLAKVISNVLMNAITNAPQESSIRCWFSSNRLNILNTNTQIPEQELSLLFEPFYRVDKSRSAGQGRTGLGLAIVKKNLDIMKIPFSLENCEEGVLFRIDFRTCGQ